MNLFVMSASGHFGRYVYNLISLINRVHSFNTSHIPGAAAESNQMVQEFPHGRTNLGKSLNAVYLNLSYFATENCQLE